MDYRKFSDYYVLRLDRGEEVLQSLALFAEREGIELASVEGLGAVDELTVGVYNVAEQKYYSNIYSGAFEIVSLHGTIDRMQGRSYSHFHICVSDMGGVCRGGHLNMARISATGEIIVHLLPGKINRKKDSVTGLNLWDFES